MTRGGKGECYSPWQYLSFPLGKREDNLSCYILLSGLTTSNHLLDFIIFIEWDNILLLLDCYSAELPKPKSKNVCNCIGKTIGYFVQLSKMINLVALCGFCCEHQEAELSSLRYDSIFIIGRINTLEVFPCYREIIMAHVLKCTHLL